MEYCLVAPFPRITGWTRERWKWSASGAEVLTSTWVLLRGTLDQMLCLTAREAPG
jgi:hypothetical protein